MADRVRAWRPDVPHLREVLHAEFTDPTGTVRKLTRDEILAIVNVVAALDYETVGLFGIDIAAFVGVDRMFFDIAKVGFIKSGQGSRETEYGGAVNQPVSMKAPGTKQQDDKTRQEKQTHVRI